MPAFLPPGRSVEVAARVLDEPMDEDLDTQLVTLAEDSAQLLDHPAMNGWSGQNLILAQAVRPLGDKLEDLPNDFVVHQIQREIAKWDEAGVLMEALETSLRAQAAWFHYADDEANAMRAVRLADSIEVIPVARNPLLSHMIGLGLEQVLGKK